MAIRTYHDLVIFADKVKKNTHHQITSFTLRVFDSPVGQGEKEETVTVPERLNDQFELADAVRLFGNRQFDQDIEHQIKLGEILADLLLPDYARDIFRRSLAWAREDEGIRLRLRLADELAAWPWEYMYIHDTRGEKTSAGFLALYLRISIVRHEALAMPAEWFVPENQRRIVLAMASPEPYATYPRLKKLPTEQQEIKEALSDITGISVEYLPEYKGPADDDTHGARLEHVMNALIKRVDIFHFSGHGEFVKEIGPGGESTIGEGAIILADESNQAVPLPAAHLAELLRSRRVRLAVLGACETGQRDSFQVWSSVAASLLKAGIPAIVAMQFKIKDSLAAVFMSAFYQALVAGLTIDEAVAAGRTAIRMKALGDNPDIRDWGVPVLYMRTPGGRIFNPVSDQSAMEKAEKETSSRVTQQIGTVGATGRVIGSMTGGVKVDKVEVIQDAKEVEGLMIGSYSINFKGGRIEVKQKMDVVNGNVVGAVLGDGSEDTSFKNMENWYKNKFKKDDRIQFGNRNSHTEIVHGDKVDGDKISVRDVSGTGIAIARGAQAEVISGVTGLDLDQLFQNLIALLQELSPEKQQEALQAADALKQELSKGIQADDSKIAKLLDGLAGLVPGAVSGLVSMFASPIISGIAGPVTKFVLGKIQGK